MGPKELRLATKPVLIVVTQPSSSGDSVAETTLLGL